MPDIELTSAELEEALTELETHQTQLDMDGIMVGVSRQALDMVITTARAGLEAGKAEESMRERAAAKLDQRVTEIATEYGDYEPDTNYTNLPEWAEGVCEELDTLATAIRALPLTTEGGNP